MDISLFDFDLPEELIAQSPAKKRDESRLMVINKDTKTYEHKHFYDIVDYLHAGDVLVRNNTKVIPARLLGEKEKTHAHHKSRGGTRRIQAGLYGGAENTQRRRIPHDAFLHRRCTRRDGVRRAVRARF